MPQSTEQSIEEDALRSLEELRYEVLHGPDIAPDGDRPERSDFSNVVLFGRLRSALERLNPHLPEAAIEEGLRKLARTESPSLIENNRSFHKMLTDGIAVSWQDEEGTQNDQVDLVAIEEAERNEFLAVNQFRVIEGKKNRIPDIVLFVNGLPLGVIELKNPGDEQATLRKAFDQLQTYKEEIPSLFITNEVLAISDGQAARVGSLTSGWDRFMPWRSITGEDLYKEPGNEQQSDGELQMGMETLFQGLFHPRRFLDYALNFVTFEDDGEQSSSIAKKTAAYHQYHAVNKAVECTLSACGIDAPAGLPFGRFREAREGDPFQEPKPSYGKDANFGDQRAGVIWHTQGSGKSLSMLFYASKLIRHPYMENPTIVVITDRNDLDGQLFTTFSNNAQLLRQTPQQADSRDDLRKKLQVASGGVVFSTIQKFLPDEEGGSYPILSERSNIVVMADEAHRSQYGFIQGFARHMHDALPNASFIGFTGTPIEQDDKNTPAVFGDYIDKYDIQRAVEDGATVPIYYESRLAKLELKEDEKPKLDEEFEAITEPEEEESQKQKERSKWASLEALVGAENRVRLVAEDLVKHFGTRQESLEGKALVVCMSRRICVDMYNAITKLKPEWHSDAEDKGRIKIVMSGSASDDPSWQQHIRSKKEREDLAARFKDPDDELQIVIVRDMWLTGFDCPALHTMYVDKPMSGHNLMQAIARVNRTFKDKPGGLVVDYIGLASELKKALTNYTASGGKGQPTLDQDQAVQLMQEKLEVVRNMFHGFDYSPSIEKSGQERQQVIMKAMDFILDQKDGKKRYLQAVTELSKAFSLSVPDDRALEVRDEVGFIQEVRSGLAKATANEAERTPQEQDSAVRQLVSSAIASNEVMDVFQAAGMEKPDISILSDEFLEEMKGIPQKNLAFETLKKLLNDEIKTRQKKNVVRARNFSEMLEEAVQKYQNRAIEAAEVIQELIDIAKEIRNTYEQDEDTDLNEDEIAFYSALADNESAKEVLGDDTLRELAQELVKKVRASVSVDWKERESARAKIRVMVKRILKQYGYPPDMQKKATELVLEQAGELSEGWVGG